MVWLQHSIRISGVLNISCVAFLAYASQAVEHTVLILLQVYHHGEKAHDPETSVSPDSGNQRDGFGHVVDGLIRNTIHTLDV